MINNNNRAVLNANAHRIRRHRPMEFNEINQIIEDARFHFRGVLHTISKLGINMWNEQTQVWIGKHQPFLMQNFYKIDQIRFNYPSPFNNEWQEYVTAANMMECELIMFLRTYIVYTAAPDFNFVPIKPKTEVLH